MSNATAVPFTLIPGERVAGLVGSGSVLQWYPQTLPFQNGKDIFCLVGDTLLFRQGGKNPVAAVTLFFTTYRLYVVPNAALVVSTTSANSQQKSPSSLKLAVPDGSTSSPTGMVLTPRSARQDDLKSVRSSQSSEHPSGAFVWLYHSLYLLNDGATLSQRDIPAFAKQLDHRLALAGAPKKFTSNHLCAAPFSIPWAAIEDIKRRAKAGDPAIKLYARDGRVFRLRFATDSLRDDVADKLHKWAFPGNLHDLYAFTYAAALSQATASSATASDQTEPVMTSVATDPSALPASFSPSLSTPVECKAAAAVVALDDGWLLYNPLVEFVRVGLLPPSTLTQGSPDSPTSVPHPAATRPVGFELTLYNQQYYLCSSFPEQLCLPAKCTAQDATLVSRFRANGRLPIAIWRYARTGSVLCRSGQPAVGLLNASCLEDEQLVSQYCEATVALAPAPAIADTLVTKRASTSADPLKGIVEQELSKAGFYVPHTVEVETRKRCFIFDLRPKINAFTNKLMGQGSELQERYPFGKLACSSVAEVAR